MGIVEPSVNLTSVLHNHTPLCPKLNCNGTMKPDFRMGATTALGLCALVCPVCGHSGYRSCDGIRVLFATRHEYVCSYGPSLKSLTVVLSGAALTSLRKKGLCPTQSALFAAHWALLCGQLVGTVRVFPESPAFVHGYAYLQREIVGDLSSHSTDTFPETEASVLQDVTCVERARGDVRSRRTETFRVE